MSLSGCYIAEQISLEFANDHLTGACVSALSQIQDQKQKNKTKRKVSLSKWFLIYLGFFNNARKKVASLGEHKKGSL